MIKLLKNYEKYPIYDNEGHKLDMRVIVFCPTIMSSANPIYETLKYLDEDDIVMEYSDDKLLDKLDEIEKENDDGVKMYEEYVKQRKIFIYNTVKVVDDDVIKYDCNVLQEV